MLEHKSAIETPVSGFVRYLAKVPILPHILMEVMCSLLTPLSVSTIGVKHRFL